MCGIIVPFSVSKVASKIILNVNHTVNRAVTMLVIAKGTTMVPAAVLRPLHAVPTAVTTRLNRTPTNNPRCRTLFLLNMMLFFVALVVGFDMRCVSSGNMGQDGWRKGDGWWWNRASFAERYFQGFPNIGLICHASLIYRVKICCVWECEDCGLKFCCFYTCR